MFDAQDKMFDEQGDKFDELGNKIDARGNVMFFGPIVSAAIGSSINALAIRDLAKEAKKAAQEEVDKLKRDGIVIVAVLACILAYALL
jgi:hypothetical protein